MRIFEKIKQLLDTRHCGCDSVNAFVGHDLEDYFQKVTECYAEFANPFWYYKHFIDRLLAIKGIKMSPLYELTSSPTDERAPVIGLRHDIDADPVTGLRCARYLAQKGICGSFYFLFTSPYYGSFYDKIFIRNPQMEKWIRSYIVSGCEIGIHNDCLKLYQDHEINGANFLKQELAWLRSIGANIRGTVAHNTGVSYGAENSEIFSGRVLWNRKLILHNGKALRLGCLSEQSLGLTYEGSFVKPKKEMDVSKAKHFFSDLKSADVRSPSWMRRYLLENPCLDWQLDYQFWLVGKDHWVAAGKFRDEVLFETEIGIDRVLDIIKSLPQDSRSVIVVHPAYLNQGA